MKGKYQTPNGEIKEVHNFDAKNKILSVHEGSGQYKFHGESEYKDWEPVGEDNENTNGLEPQVFETDKEDTDEHPKKVVPKKTTKKK